MTLRIFATILLVALGQLATAQYNKDNAIQDLKALKDGMLLVRLKSSQNQIEALQKQGLDKEAEKRKNQQYLDNKEIILSFGTTFDFCPVYFFYDVDSKKITDGEFEGVVLNQNLSPVDPGELKSVYRACEFSQTEKLGIHGLIMLDQYLLPLQKPFPYYQRQYVFFSLMKLSKAEVISRQNKRLWDVYEKWVVKAEGP